MSDLEIRGVPLATVLRLNAARTINLARYQDGGCIDRLSYLESLADDHGVDLGDVLAIADVLGPNEDFDGLVTTFEDGI